MILFPYAADLEYTEDQRIKFTMKFFNKTSTTDVKLSFPVDDELRRTIEGLFDNVEDYEEQELWKDE
jgi:hypothetical protein